MRVKVFQSSWLRLVLLLLALGAAGVGQWWLSIEFNRNLSACAWTIAAVLLLIAMLDPRTRALPEHEPRLAPWVEWPAFLAVMLVGVFFRVYRLDILPQGLNVDVAWNGLYAVRILNGERYTPYVGEAWGRETLMFYLQALSIKLFGMDVFAMVVPAIVAGLGLLVLFYFWVRALFGPRLALGSSFFLAVSGWAVVFSRTGWRAVLQPFISTFAYLFFIRGMNIPSVVNFAFAGAGAAGAIYTYNASRTMPALFPLFLLYKLVVGPDRRGFLRRYWWGAVVMAIAFVIVIFPMARYAWNNWIMWQGRATATYFLDGTTFWGNVKATSLLYSYLCNGDDFFTHTPLLEYPTAVLFAFGFVWCVLQWRDERSMFLLLGLVVSLVPGVFSKPNANRGIGSLPFIYVFVGLGAAFFVRELQAIPRIGRYLTVVAIVGLAGAASYATYAQYLGPDRRPIRGYYPETTRLGRYMKTLLPQYAIWVGGSNFPRDALTFFTYQGFGHPEHHNYTWLDDPPVLLRTKIQTPPGKGAAFIMGPYDQGPVVLGELARRYPEHELVELREPPETGAVFATALLVPAKAVAHSAEDDNAIVLAHTKAFGQLVERRSAGPAEVADIPPQEAPSAAAVSGNLKQPRGVAATRDGNLFICDFGHDCIQEFSPSLKPVRAWGGRGVGPGQFNQPCGIVAAPSGEIFVADTWNARVQVFSAAGKFLRQWKENFFGPRGIAVDATGTVFVVDTGNNRIVRFSADGKKEIEWGGPGSNAGQFDEPVGIAVDNAGKVYVCDNGNGRLQIFTRDGKFVSAFKVPGWEIKVFSEPTVTLDPRGTLWVTVPGAKEVRNYDASGKLLRTITSTSLSEVKFETPMGITYSAATREIIVTDLAGAVARIPYAER